ncbi:S-adenosylmethionine sensor upstream of mTORC1 [Anthonomus grandis grandis]|uniref:S-adenosylmethionine sensor upstream of mTORC1 n=1 Tax=Anthonomus grandis grandis TaxID=2921223 RepID=UPI002165B1E2|nr:S-adenosylmethionine sensor upstream of mTORC1 [Anthonomus grandis grandis]
MSTEHKTLANFIKSVHKKLRDETKTLGSEIAWQNHCSNEENLRKYARAMHDLAVKHWDFNAQNNDKVISRVMWVYDSTIEYFSCLDKYWQKEIRIHKNNSFGEVVELGQLAKGERLKVLDVGSCYNPFSTFKEFDVMAVDIAPANAEVLKCDFLKVNIGNATFIENGTLISLQENFFDIIVFSLILEYLPSPKQRLKICLNAYDLLKFEGILAIITPDSNHIGSNIKIFKSWQFVLAKYGFVRVKYEKLPHMHCMLFRKTPFPEVARRWADIHRSEGFYDEIFIPQDFTREKVTKENRLEDQEVWCHDTFLQDFNCF